MQMPPLTFNVDFLAIVVYVITVGFLVRDRYTMVGNHEKQITALTEKLDKTINEFSSKLAELSIVLAGLKAEFDTFKEMATLGRTNTRRTRQRK